MISLNFKTQEEKSVENIDLKEAAKGLKSLKDIHEFVKQMTKGLIENVLQEEMNQHLGYKKYEHKEASADDTRNGISTKLVTSSVGNIELNIPRDRDGKFNPQLIKKYQTDISDLDMMIISMYAKGMTTRDIQGHFEEIYGAEISPGAISIITNKVTDIAHEWQQRPLAGLYAIAYFDALFYKVRENGKIIAKAAYVCLGIDQEGKKDILGLWIADTEGASYWLKILNELKARGVTDILIACIDGLNGLGKAIEAVFPHTEIQRCIIHMIRNSLKYIPHKHRKEFIKDLKMVYTASSESEAHYELLKLIDKWGKKYSLATKPWFEHWEEVSAYFKYPPELRRIIYTTNAIEALNRQFRKVTKNRSVFANDDSLIKLLYLASRDIQKKWTIQTQNWALIISQLHIFFQERLMINLTA